MAILERRRVCGVHLLTGGHYNIDEVTGVYEIIKGEERIRSSKPFNRVIMADKEIPAEVQAFIDEGKVLRDKAISLRAEKIAAMQDENKV